MFTNTMEIVSICSDRKDAWVWMVGNSKEYSVKPTYDLLLSKRMSLNILTGPNEIFKKFWLSCAPTKILAFSWQLLLDRLPIRVNLHQRHIIPDVTLCCCVLCGIEQQTVSHLFLHCAFLQRVWVHQDIHSFYISHRQLIRGNKMKKFRSLFWHATVWSLWLIRNEIIFKGGLVDFLAVLEQIKLRSWFWFSAEFGSSVYTITDWCLCPLGCLC